MEIETFSSRFHLDPGFKRHLLRLKCSGFGFEVFTNTLNHEFASRKETSGTFHWKGSRHNHNKWKEFDNKSGIKKGANSSRSIPSVISFNSSEISITSPDTILYSIEWKSYLESPSKKFLVNIPSRRKEIRNYGRVNLHVANFCAQESYKWNNTTSKSLNELQTKKIILPLATVFWCSMLRFPYWAAFVLNQHY